MKQKEKQELRASSVEEITKKLKNAQQNLAELVKERYTRQSKNVRESKLMRQMIARFKTILREKELSV